jgi:pyridoxal phosphate enzyme (YggS family)
MDIAENLNQIKRLIKEAAEEVQRDPAEITLVAVTKTVPVGRIQEAVDAGAMIIGENRVQEARMKYDELNRQVEWHLIGHLQTNKVKTAVDLFDLIHSVDRIEVAKEIQRRAEALNKRQRILVQVNTSNEVTKSGCNPEEAEKLIHEIAVMENLHLEGLMTIGPLTDNQEAIQNSFRTLKGIFDRLRDKGLKNVEMKHLSMGMSSDFQMAIKEGSTMVRVGSAIFGARNYI